MQSSDKCTIVCKRKTDYILCSNFKMITNYDDKQLPKITFFLSDKTRFQISLWHCMLAYLTIKARNMDEICLTAIPKSIYCYTLLAITHIPSNIKLCNTTVCGQTCLCSITEQGSTWNNQVRQNKMAEQLDVADFRQSIKTYGSPKRPSVFLAWWLSPCDWYEWLHRQQSPLACL